MHNSYMVTCYIKSHTYVLQFIQDKVIKTTRTAREIIQSLERIFISFKRVMPV